jgi:hypothetical protein
MRMRKILVPFLFLPLWVPLCDGQDLQPAKISDVHAYSDAGAPIIAPNNGHPVLIPISRDMFSLTVIIGDMAYTAQYSVSRQLKPADLIVGDSVPARIDGKKLVVEMPDHKIKSATIIRKERLSSSEPKQ